MPLRPALTRCIDRCRPAIAAALAALALAGCGGGPPPGWTEPFPLTASAGTATDLRMAWAGGKRALVVWETEEAGIRRVQALWLSAIGFEGPTTLDTPGPGVPRAPDLAVDAQGRAVVVWLQAQGGADRVWARRFDPVTGWAPAEVLNAAAAGNDRTPRVAVHRNGSALVTWLRDVLNIGSPVMARAFQPGRGWGPEWRLDTSPGAPRAPAVTIDGQGRGMVVWPQQNTIFSGPFPLWGRDVDLATGTGTTTRVETLGPDALMAQLVTLDDGSVLTAWPAVFPVSAPSRLMATSRFDPTAGWSLPLQPGGFVTDIQDLTLAAGRAGASAVLWSELQDGRQRLALNRLVGSQLQNATPTIVFDQPAAVPPAPLLPQIVLDADNRAIWIWQQGPQGASALWASDQIADAAPATPVRLDQGPSAGISSAGLALGPEGEALAAWTQNTASGARVWAAWRHP